MIVTLLETVTVQELLEVEVQPDHELKLLLAVVAGAVKLTVVPELSVRVNGVVPVVTGTPPVEDREYPIVTPLAGFVLAIEIV